MQVLKISIIDLPQSDVLHICLTWPSWLACSEEHTCLKRDWVHVYRPNLKKDQDRTCTFIYNDMLRGELHTSAGASFQCQHKNPNYPCSPGHQGVSKEFGFSVSFIYAFEGECCFLPQWLKTSSKYISKSETKINVCGFSEAFLLDQLIVAY